MAKRGCEWLLWLILLVAGASAHQIAITDINAAAVSHRIVLLSLLLCRTTHAAAPRRGFEGPLLLVVTWSAGAGATTPISGGCNMVGTCDLARNEWFLNEAGATVTYGHIAVWDMSQVTSTFKMFYNKGTFNADLSAWDTSSVTTMYQMFYKVSMFNSDLNAWDTASVTMMAHMLSSIYHPGSVFNSELNAWDTASVTNMYAMFCYAVRFNGEVNAWDTASVTTMGFMIQLASAFNGELNAWDTASVSDMVYMFYSASVFNRDISAWNVGSVTDMSSIFDGAANLTDCYKSRIYDSWITGQGSDLAGVPGVWTDLSCISPPASPPVPPPLPPPPFVPLTTVAEEGDLTSALIDECVDDPSLDQSGRSRPGSSLGDTHRMH